MRITETHRVQWLTALAACALMNVTYAQAPETPSSALTGRTIQAIGYITGSGTTVDLKPTGLLGGAKGKADVEAKPGVTKVEVEVDGLSSPTQLGSEFLTYVLWAVSNEGRAQNLGELLVDSDHAHLRTTTQFQTFSLFVTAEPYAAVRQPSEMLVLENATRSNTKGRIFPVQDYKLMRRSQYERLSNPLALSLDLKNVPLNMYEARNAIEIARARGADHYAPEIYTKAEASLKMAENALARKDNKKQIITLANQTTQFSEDARALTLERQEAERVENARLAAAAKAKADAEAKAAVEAAEAKRRADEEARRQQELASAREAQLKAEADAKAALARAEAAAKEAQLKAEAAAKEAQAKAEAAAIKAQADIAAAKAQAEADALKAKEEAARAEAEKAQQAARDLRAQLLEQFNRILETRDSVRGLVVTMADVLFDIGKYDLRPPTRESLAKFAGIVLAHPGLKIEVEGHTDSTGSDELNQKLSEQRADTVRTYLISQGLDGNSITAKGFGKDMPVASNDTADGRKKNRRVELIVSGQVIGVTIGSLDLRETPAGGTAETAGLIRPNH